MSEFVHRQWLCHHTAPRMVKEGQKEAKYQVAGSMISGSLLLCPARTVPPIHAHANAVCEWMSLRILLANTAFTRQRNSHRVDIFTWKHKIQVRHHLNLMGVFLCNRFTPDEGLGFELQHTGHDGLSLQICILVEDIQCVRTKRSVTVKRHSFLLRSLT